MPKMRGKKRAIATNLFDQAVAAVVQVFQNICKLNGGGTMGLTWLFLIHNDDNTNMLPLH